MYILLIFTAQVIKRKAKLKSSDNNRKGGASRREKERSVESDSCDSKNSINVSLVLICVFISCEIQDF